MLQYRKLMTGNRHLNHDTFWRDALSRWERDTEFRLPARAFARPPQQRVSIQMELEPMAAKTLLDLGKQTELGAYVVLASGLFCLLRRYGVAGPVIATPTIKQAPARFESTLPLVPQFSDGNVRDLLSAMKTCISGAYTYQDFPVSELFEAMAVEKHSTAVLLSCDAVHGTDVDGDYALHLNLQRLEPLTLTLSANAPGFDETFLEQLSYDLSQILAGFADLQCPLRFLGPSWVAPLYGASLDLTSNTTIHASFQAIAATHADRLAISGEHGQLTYAQLDARANALARHLSEEMGVRPGSVVAALPDRSPDGVVALLAVLKVGAIFLPLDPSAPPERLALVIEDAAAVAVLLHASFLDKMVGLYHVPMFALNLQLDGLEAAECAPLAKTCADSPAYIIYTSGSTGKPKGVLLRHRGFLNMIFDHIRYFEITQEDVVGRFYAQAFDSSLFEIFVGLLSGARLVTADKETIADPDSYSRLLERERVSVAVFPPVYMASLNQERLCALRVVLNAGDACKTSDAAFHARQRRFYNSYGPTEASVCASYYRVNPAIDYDARIPIGRPVANSAAMLLDHQGRSVPLGIAGELCLSGPGLAMGYLNRPALTAASFQPAPFGHGERLYRTGDLALLLADGNMELIGRADNQVKVRGYRVELGEIESVFIQNELVNQAVVLYLECQGEKRLVAYYTGSPELDAAQARCFLEPRLPEYMLPGRFVHLDRWPQTANGKIDRQALAAMPLEHAEAGQALASYVAPETENERKLAKAWSQVLGVAAVGRNDNFFKLGGDSILVIRMISLLAREGLRLAARQLFNHDTLAELAAVAEEVSISVAEQGPVTGPLPLAAMQQWFFEQGLVNEKHYNQSVLLAVPANLSPTFLEAAVAAVLDHHDGLRSRFRVGETGVIAELASPGETVPFDMVDHDPWDDRWLESHASRLQASLDPENGPLFRVRLLRTGADQDRLLIVAHHLVVDGVSWRIILEDLHETYQTLAAGGKLQLPPKTFSVREWGQRLQALVANDGLKQELDFWVRTTANPILLPTDFACEPGANTVAGERVITQHLDAAQTEALLRKVPQAFQTRINDVLLTALLLAYRDFCGKNSLTLNLEGHGREELFEDLDLSRTVGWFTAIYPVTLHLEHDPLASLKAIKEQLRAVPGQGIGYGLLRYLARESALQGPTPSLVFNYLGQTDTTLQAGTDWLPLLTGAGAEQAGENQRDHQLLVSAMVNDGQLVTSWSYHPKLHTDATIAGLAAGFQHNLSLLIERCCLVEKPGFTPSDFPAAKMNQSGLDKLFAKLNA